MTIGEMSKKTSLPESTLRYYEKRNRYASERYTALFGITLFRQKNDARTACNAANTPGVRFGAAAKVERISAKSG